LDVCDHCWEGVWYAYIQKYSGLEVHFTLEWETVVNIRKGYVWNIATDEIGENIAYPNLTTDTFSPTGEVVMALEDDRFPYPKIPENLIDPFEPRYNSLQVYDPIQRERYPFYNAWGLPQFVQNGERILVLSSDTDILIERNGTKVGTWQ